MSSPIEGKITNILTPTKIAINVGKNSGVQEGMRFQILGSEVHVVDPDTKEEIGVLNFVKAEVRVTTVYERFSIAESYETIVSDLLPFPTFFTTRVVTKRLPVASSVTFEQDTDLKVGDRVMQIVEQKTEKDEPQQKKPTA